MASRMLGGDFRSQGGGQDDEANGITLDSARNVYLIGETYSTNFPTTSGAYDEINTQSDKRDAFIAKFGALDPYAASSIDLNIPVLTSSDDAEEKASGNVSLTSSDLELVYDGSLQTVGLRFTDLNIPQGAIIQNAWIQFLVDTATSEATNLSIRTQASDDPPTFAATSNNISSRPKTTASVSWTPPAWSTLDEAGPDQRTPNLASVMQEVVDRPGWTSGNAMAFLITGTGQRLAKSYDGEVYGAPYLHVEYTLPEPPPTPTPTVTDTPTPTFTPTTTPTPSGPVTIIYDYDPLYRLTSADHSTGDYYHYTYDAVGNRLTEQTHLENTTYVYDNANRLASVNAVPYTWDDNGNLLNDGISTYIYDAANRLKQLVQGANTYTFGYNGMGDRLSQNGVQYILDLNAGLTQVLKDGTNTYLYGLEKIAQVNDTATEYFLGDALDSVRQLSDAQGSITFTQSYTAYGDVMASAGDSASPFAFTGEQLDSYINLIYLRSRLYDPASGRFTTKDLWRGDYNRPLSLNRWNYVEANPVNYTDPSGLASSAYSRLLEIRDEVAPNGAEALFRSFEDFELYAKWGNEAGRTSRDRLEWLLRVTTGAPDSLTNAIAPYVLVNFAMDFGSDCGFAVDFRDSNLYRIWGKDPSESNQVGHFLTAVNMTYYWELVHKSNAHPDSMAAHSKWALYLILGHEQMSDEPPYNVVIQPSKPITWDFILWNQAVEFDSKGQYQWRDDALWAILKFSADIPMGGVDPNRVGNSLQDLRLSLKGYRFAHWVWDNPTTHPAQAGRWLRMNIGIPSLFRD